MIITLISFMFAIGLAVFIHELGHFIFAKRAGIYCHEFAIGMGPKLFSKKYGETIYSIRLIPMGGFVSMAGEGIEFEKEVPKDRFVQEASWLNRFLTFFMGAGFNFLLALVLAFIVALSTGVPSEEPIIGDITEGGAAEEAGLQPGDKIIEINGESIVYWSDIKSTLNQEIVTVKIERNDEVIIKDIKLDYNEAADRYYMGISSGIEKGILLSIKYSFTYLITSIKTMFYVISGLITGKLDPSNLAGPVGIAKMAGEAGSAGIIPLLSFTAFLSINLGFVNLLPIPAFDGGRLLILIAEGITRRRINPKLEYALQFIGFALIIFLLLFVTYNDVFGR